MGALVGHPQMESVGLEGGLELGIGEATGVAWLLAVDLDGAVAEAVGGDPEGRPNRWGAAAGAGAEHHERGQDDESADRVHGRQFRATTSTSTATTPDAGRKVGLATVT